MKKIWAPWRIRYIEMAMERSEGCIFCSKINQNEDDKNLILYRGKKCFIIMNKFPYNPGHLMVAPYRHIASYEDLEEKESLELNHLIGLSLKVLKEVMKPDGFNIGVNLGRVAGAGVEGHLHVHIVPRWNGDTNFMPILADIKVIPEALEDTYKKLKEKFKQKEGR